MHVIWIMRMTSIEQDASPIISVVEFSFENCLVYSNVKCRSKIAMIDLRVIRMMIGLAHFCENPMAPKLDGFFKEKFFKLKPFQPAPETDAFYDRYFPYQSISNPFCM